MLRLDRRRCVVVGGGATALRRARALAEAGGQVTVVAPSMVEGLGELPGVERRERRYESADVEGAWLVVIATDDPAVNDRVAKEAAAAGALINRADRPTDGDLTVMAHGRRGPLTLAVDTANHSAAAGKAIRDEWIEALDPAWVQLLEAAGPWRPRIQAAVQDPAERSRRLRRLTDGQARRILSQQGIDALHSHLQRVAEGPDAAP
jgi:precorrin-2 dehydrogenase/sirohydrochlorin ferrochelatase